jgi:hypothetical protein
MFLNQQILAITRQNIREIEQLAAKRPPVDPAAGTAIFQHLCI